MESGHGARSDPDPESTHGCPDCGNRLRRIWCLKLGRVGQTNACLSCGWTGNLSTLTDLPDWPLPSSLAPDDDYRQR
jgi:predicted RNA-binding Zn-ribbon protein involved in translation (DUF1610 family)